jgi:hypothetical protein
LTERDRPQFALTLAALAAAYREELDEAAYEGYWLALGDLSLEAIRGACKAAARTQKFMPKAAEIREIATIEATRVEQAQRLDVRRREFALALSWNITQEADRKGWDESTLRSELNRVGDQLGVCLPILPRGLPSKE